MSCLMSYRQFDVSEFSVMSSLTIPKAIANTFWRRYASCSRWPRLSGPVPAHFTLSDREYAGDTRYSRGALHQMKPLVKCAKREGVADAALGVNASKFKLMRKGSSIKFNLLRRSF